MNKPAAAAAFGVDDREQKLLAVSGALLQASGGDTFPAAGQLGMSPGIAGVLDVQHRVVLVRG